jgi:ELWxxDGT repeat protein
MHRHLVTSVGWISAAALLWCASPGFADAVVRRVKDLDTGAARAGGGVCRSFFSLGPVELFAGALETTGCELFRTDDSPAGGHLVEELELGPGGRVDQFLGSVGSQVFFSGETSERGYELWRTDGTAAGTLLLRDIAPGPDSSYPGSFTTLGSIGIFFAEDIPHGYEPWVTDGTIPGTHLLGDLWPGYEGSVAYGSFYPDEVKPVVFGSSVFFAADDGVSGNELWSTDGTSANTRLAVEVRPGYFGSYPSELTVWNGYLLFFADDATGRGLWRSDGTPAGTAELASFSGDWGVSGLVALGSRVFFGADDGVSGRELWESDGTAAGTRRVRDIFPGPDGARVFELEPVGSRVFFLADDGEHGMEPWLSDGTEAGTRMLRDIRPGAEGSEPDCCWNYQAVFAASGERVLFTADDDEHGFELWTSDGTEAGTTLLEDVYPGPESSYPSFLGHRGELLVVSLRTPSGGTQLFETDGTAAGTRQITALGWPVTPTDFSSFTDAHGTLLFAADVHDGSWMHPWRSDGTEAGTIPLKGDLGDYLGPVTWAPLAGGLTVAKTDAEDAGSLLWSTDGLYIYPVGVFAVACHHRTCGLGPELRPAPEAAVFEWERNEDRELWASDGTPAGTGLIKDVNPGPESSSPRNFVPLLEGTGFLARSASGDSEVWITRGTTASTRFYANLGGSGNESGALDFWPDEDRPGSMFFSREGPGLSEELWYYDAGSESDRWLGVAFGIGGATVRPLGSVGGRWIFSAVADGQWYNDELWSSDGTVEGTIRLAAIWPGDSGAFIRSSARIGDRVLFRACSATDGCELWSSDGTVEGTGLLESLVPGRRSSYPSGLTTIEGRVYFAACEIATGCEPWVSDGTLAGTHRIADIAPGPLSGMAVDTETWYGDPEVTFTESAGRIYFAADDGTGTELWSMAPEIFYDGFETGDLRRWISPGPG